MVGFSLLAGNAAIIISMMKHEFVLRDVTYILFQMKMTDEEKLKLYEEIVRTRRALSECRLLQRPAFDHRASVFKTTLRK